MDEQLQCGASGFCARHPVPKHEPSPGTPGQDIIDKNAKIRRPANAFMIFAQEHRKQVAHDNPRESNKAVSTLLGIMWRHLDKIRKDEYYSKAKQLEIEHKLKYPDYIYNPKEARQRKEIRTRNKLMNKTCLKNDSNIDLLGKSPSSTSLLTKSGIAGQQIKFLQILPSVSAQQQAKTLIMSSAKLAEQRKEAIKEQVYKGMGVLEASSDHTQSKSGTSTVTSESTEAKQDTPYSVSVPSETNANSEPTTTSSSTPSSSANPHSYQSKLLHRYGEHYFTPPSHLLPRGYSTPPRMIGVRHPSPYVRYHKMISNPWEFDKVRPPTPYAPTPRYIFMHPRHSQAPPHTTGHYGMPRTPYPGISSMNINEEEEDQGSEVDLSVHEENCQSASSWSKPCSCSCAWSCYQYPWSPATCRQPFMPYRHPWAALPTMQKMAPDSPKVEDPHDISPPSLSSGLNSAVRSPYADIPNIQKQIDPHASHAAYHSHHTWKPWYGSKQSFVSYPHYHSYDPKEGGSDARLAPPHLTPGAYHQKDNINIYDELSPSYPPSHALQYYRGESEHYAASITERHPFLSDEQYPHNSSSNTSSNSQNLISVVDDSDESMPCDTLPSINAIRSKAESETIFGNAITDAVNVLNYDQPNSIEPIDLTCSVSGKSYSPRSDDNI